MSAYLLLAIATAVQSAATQIETAPRNEAQQTVASGDFRFTVDANSRFGVFTYLPGQWGELHLRIENGGKTARELLCTSYLGEQTDLQFGRRVWVPPQSRLMIDHPILFPSAEDIPDGSVNVRSLVIEGGAGEEVLVKNEASDLLSERALLMTQADRNTGVVAGWSPDDAVPQDVLDVVAAVRVNQRLNGKATVVSGHFLPSDATNLEYLDHIVLAENRLVDDFAALAAVRQWLHAGGRLWIMLDRVDPLLLERLFGDEFQGTVVDRVALTSVRVDKAPSLLAPDGEAGQTTEYEEPVEMARVVMPGMEVRHTVNGWPASLTRSFGEGRVLVTTLSPRGWMKPTPRAENTAAGVAVFNIASDFIPTSPMEDLAAFILEPREPEALPPVALAPFAQEYIAYTVPSWSLIVGTMVGFLAVLSAVGIWLWRKERLEHFGWSGSLLGLVFGMALIGTGMANRHSVPETMASVQFAQAVNGTDDVRTQGILGVYRTVGSDAPISTTHGGKVWPDMTGIEGATRRMVTTDLGAYRWEGLPQPAGLRMHTATTAATFANRVSARSTLDDSGIVGQFAGHSTAGSDAIVATRHGRVGIRFTGDGAFVGEADNVLEADQYLSATFLGDVQDRRRRVLEALFESPSWQGSLERPQFLIWVTGWDPEVQFGDGLTHMGDTLLTVPLEINRPAPGTDIRIPSPLISYVATRPPDGSTPAGFWDDARGEWQERSSASTTWLDFRIPRNLLPLKATQARLEIKVSGLMGRLEMLGVKNGEVVSLQTVDDPVGLLTIDIDDPDVLTVSDDGEITLAVSAGVVEDSTGTQGGSAQAAGAPANYWRIDSLTLQLWATTAESLDEE